MGVCLASTAARDVETDLGGRGEGTTGSVSSGCQKVLCNQVSSPTSNNSDNDSSNVGPVVQVIVGSVGCCVAGFFGILSDIDNSKHSVNDSNLLSSHSSCKQCI